jgi:hypothetical protein
MLIDPHVNPYEMTIHELIDAVIEASLDAVVVTCTHNSKKAKAYVQALEAEEFLAFYGVELHTEYGSIVWIPQTADQTFFDTSWQSDDSSFWSLSDLQRLLASHKGIALLSHPYSRLKARSWGDRAFTLPFIHCVETRIGRGLAARDFLSDQMAAIKGWGHMGSCSGEVYHLGKAATVISDGIETQEDLYQALSTAVCWPIEFEDTRHPRTRYQGIVADEGPRRLNAYERERREALQDLDHRQGFKDEASARGLHTHSRGHQGGRNQNRTYGRSQANSSYDKIRPRVSHKGHRSSRD